MTKLYFLTAIFMSFSVFALPKVYELEPGSSTIHCRYDIDDLNADLLQQSFYTDATVLLSRARINVTKPYKVVSFTPVKDNNCVLIEKK